MKPKLKMVMNMKGQNAPSRAVNFDDDAPAPAQPAAQPAAAPQTATATETVQVAEQPQATGTALSAGSGNLPAVQKPQPINKQALEDMGFGGLDFGFGAFPQIVLQEGSFQCSTDQVDLGKQFSAVITSSRQKHIYKNNGARKEDEDFFYSYDKIVATDGELVEDKLAVWKEKGWSSELKTYLDVTAQIVNCPATPAYNNRLVLLSIPPSSVARLSGHLATMSAFGKDPREVPTNISVGPKVTKAVQPFYPWQFDMPR